MRFQNQYYLDQLLKIDKRAEIIFKNPQCCHIGKQKSDSPVSASEED